jgi:hypothetical protein
MHDSIEMPRYKCHKTVWALKIAAIKEHGAHSESGSGAVNDGGATIVPADTRYAPFEVDQEFMRKHQPKSGGYYVRYEDGYESYSPAEAFESGYTRI